MKRESFLSILAHNDLGTEMRRIIANRNSDSVRLDSLKFLPLTNRTAEENQPDQLYSTLTFCLSEHIVLPIGRLQRNGEEHATPNTPLALHSNRTTIFLDEIFTQF